MNLPPANRLREARRQFVFLLGQPRVPERAWQQLFAENPFILSSALPLKLSPGDIVPLGRPGRREPDLVFFPNNSQKSYSYGVIELKRADHNILVARRKDVLTLASSAHTAIMQADAYLRDLRNRIRVERPSNNIFIGTSEYAFIIMGLQSNLATALVNDILMAQFRDLLPKGFQIIPYDLLLEMFEANAFPRIFRLVQTAMAGGTPELLADFLGPVEREALLLLAEHGNLAQYPITGFLATVDYDGYDHVHSSESEDEILRALGELTTKVPALVASIDVGAPLPQDGPAPDPDDTVSAFGLTSLGEEVARALRRL